MANYRLIKRSDGTYSISGTLAPNGNVMHRSVRINISKAEVGPAVISLANEINIVRKQHKAVGDGTGIPEVVR